MTEVELEEEAYSKILIIVLAILVVIIVIFVFDIMTGGYLIRNIVSMLVWASPFGPFLKGYIGIHGIPI